MNPTANNNTYAVIGASGGIGASLSRLLSRRGARLFLGGRRTDALQTLATELGAEWLNVDAREFDQVERFLAEANQAESPLAGVVNCAGSVLLKPAHITSPTELENVIGTNLTTAFATVRAAARVLRRDGGSVVLVSAAAASIGLPNHEAIAAAKAGVEGLTRSAAATYASRAIRFNAVAPGLVATPLTDRITGNEKALEASLRLHPMGRIGQPEEIASLIAWLLGPDSSWVTGQVIQIDGGLARLKVDRAA